MKKRIAWLIESGDKSLVDSGLYGDMFPDYEIDFFEIPDYLKENLNNGYNLFILGLVRGRDTSMGLRLIDGIRANKKTKDAPILILSTLADAEPYKSKIEEKSVASITKPYDIDQLKGAVDSLI